MKKILLVLAVPAIIIIIFLGITNPTVKKLSACMDTFNSEMEKQLVTIRTEKWDKYKLCKEGKPLISDLLTCYESAEKGSILPISLIFNAAGLIKPSVKNVTREKFLELHNTSCKKFPDTLIEVLR